MTSRSAEALRLGEAEAIDVGIVRDLRPLVRAIAAAVRDGVIYLEDPASPEVEAWLADRPAHDDEVRPVAKGTTWPRTRAFHVPLNPETIAGLARFAERLAQPEVCAHLVVYREQTVLVEAYDAGDNVVRVNRALGDDAIAAFREALAD